MKKALSTKRPREKEENTNGTKESASPVYVVAPPSSSTQQRFGLESQTLMKDLLYPLEPVEFMTKYFRNQAVHVKGSAESGENGKKKSKKKANRYQPIIQDGMFNLEVEQLVKETSSDSIFVWLAAAAAAVASKDDQSDKKSRYNNPLIQSIELPDADTALALHKSNGNHALYCRAPPQVEQVLVAKMLKDTGLGCGQYDPSGDSLTCLARGEVEMFLTSKAGGITDWHYDFQENFTLQLSGIKKWTLQRGSVRHPLRACTPHYQAPDVVENQLKAAHLSSPEFCFEQPTTKEDDSVSFNAVGPTDEVVLKPGDALYFPAGMWHKIEVIEPGVSINISLMATNYANITCQALQHYLLQREEWRQALVNNPGSKIDAVEHLKSLLKELPSIIQQFEAQGGASAILPPVLQQAPNFLHAEEDDDDDDKEEEENGDEEGAHKPPAKKSKTVESYSNEDEQMDEDDNKDAESEDWGDVAIEEEDDNMFDPYNFEYPTGYTGPCGIEKKATAKLLETHRLFYSPLANLLHMREVTSYYGRRMTGAFEQDEDLFVLNVNYAGVESHESAVRIVLRGNGEADGFLHQLLKARRENGLEVLFAEKIAQHCPSMIHCLLYHGLFVLVPRKR